MRIAVVIPCYKVVDHICDVISKIGPEVDRIYAVDDACPVQSADIIEKNVTDERVVVLRHEVNKGVGGAVMTGYRAALADGMEVVVKIDGDGQMDPALLPLFIHPIERGEADYVKGNRFFSASAVREMPRMRLIGNAGLSLMTKLSSGYWSIFDPTNGYTAIHARALASLDLDTLSERYFFETDMLIRLGDVRAVVMDIPMRAFYDDETSGLKVSTVFGEFLCKHVYASIRRIVYHYFLRDFNVASINLVFGLLLLAFGAVVGVVGWVESYRSGIPAMTGTIMLSVLPIIIGFQMLLFFLGYDINTESKRPVQRQSVLSSLDPARGYVKGEACGASGMTGGREA